MHGTFRSFCILILSLILAITLCGAEQPQQKGSSVAAHSGREFGQKRKIKGIPNFGEVTPTLFRGAQPTHDGLQALAKMGIEIVVDARANRADSEGKEVGQLGMQYVTIPWHCMFPSDEIFIRFLKLLQENPNKKVFVHCRLGDDRTGMMVAAYRMAVQGWTADEAMQEMQQFGFSTIHHFICPGLAFYEGRFPQHLESNPAFQGLRPSTQSAPK